MKIIVKNDGEIIHNGDALNFLLDNDFDETMIEMVKETMLTGKCIRDIFHSGFIKMESIED